MGQKVNPHGLRVGVIKDWDSRWFEKDETFGDTLVSDYKIRKYLKENLKLAGVPKIEIERNNAGVKVLIHCAKPGMVIGRGGVEIEKLRVKLEKMTGKAVAVNVAEVKSPDMDAQLVAESVATQLEKRIAFRRAMKQAIGRTMRLGAKGIKITLSGRLGGAEIARTEHYHEGTIPLQTLRADIDVKTWIYKGEVLADKKLGAAAPVEKPREQRRNDHRGDRRRNPSQGQRRSREEGGRK